MGAYICRVLIFIWGANKPIQYSGSRKQFSCDIYILGLGGFLLQQSLIKFTACFVEVRKCS